MSNILRHCLTLGLGCLLWLFGCSAEEDVDAAEGGADAPVVLDSAGVRIVENSVPGWQPQDAWRLASEPVLEIRGAGADPDGRLLDPASVYRTDDGRYVIADGRFAGLNEVLVFDHTGRYLMSMGGEGRGPCEFRQLWWAAPYRGDSIAAYDHGDHTVVIFTADGHCGRELRLPTWSPPQAPGTYGYSEGAEGVYADGSFLIYPGGYLDISTGTGPVWYRHAMLRVSPEGAVVDSLDLFAISQRWWNGREQKMLPFAASGVRAIADDELYYGTGEVFEVHRYDRAGQLQSTIRRADDPTEISAADRQTFRTWYLERVARSPEGGSAAVERAESMLDNLEFPETKPAFSEMFVDSEGNLWVEEYRWMDGRGISPDPKPVQWSVFDAAGTWLGNVEVPGRLLLRSIGEDHVIGFWKDADHVTHVRIYELIKALIAGRLRLQ